MLDDLKKIYESKLKSIKSQICELDDKIISESFETIMRGICHKNNDVNLEIMKVGLCFAEAVKSPEDNLILIEQHLQFIKETAGYILNYDVWDNELKQEALNCIMDVTSLIIIQTAKIVIDIYKQELYKTFALQKIAENISIQLRNVLNTQISFIANISHDMKTPLHSIIGYLTVLKSDKNLPSDKVKFVENALVSAEILLNLVNDVLDAAKVTVGEIEIVKEPFWLSDVVRDIYEIFYPLVEEKGLKFKTEYSPIPYQIISDKRRITQIVMNLISNSLKFTEKGYILLAVRIQGDHLIIEVEDTGIGIPKDKIPEIFKPFYQTRSDYGKFGAGLGLFIVKTLVNKMGGTISVDSELGKGTKITISFKVEFHEPEVINEVVGKSLCIIYGKSLESIIVNLKVQLEAVGAKTYIFTNISQFLQLLFKSEISIEYLMLVEPLENFMKACQLSAIVKNFNNNIKILAVTEHCPKQCKETYMDMSVSKIPSLEIICEFIRNLGKTHVISTNPINILVVDDEPFNREVLVMNIKNIFKNAIIDTAVNGAEAVEKILQKKYDVVFMDLRMPVLDGLKACRLIRKKNIKTPIYLLTADVIKTTYKEAEEAGATGVLPKPMRVDKIKEILNLVQKNHYD